MDGEVKSAWYLNLNIYKKNRYNINIYIYIEKERGSILGAFMPIMVAAAVTSVWPSTPLATPHHRAMPRPWSSTGIWTVPSDAMSTKRERLHWDFSSRASLIGSLFSSLLNLRDANDPAKSAIRSEQRVSDLRAQIWNSLSKNISVYTYMHTLLQKWKTHQGSPSS